MEKEAKKAHNKRQVKLKEYRNQKWETFEKLKPQIAWKMIHKGKAQMMKKMLASVGLDTFENKMSLRIFWKIFSVFNQKDAYAFVDTYWGP